MIGQISCTRFNSFRIHGFNPLCDQIRNGKINSKQVTVKKGINVLYEHIGNGKINCINRSISFIVDPSYLLF